MTAETGIYAGFEIRPASKADIPAIARLSRDYIEYGLPWRWRPAALARCMEDGYTEVITAVDGARMLGFCAATLHKRAHVLLLAVKPRVRRRGIARALLGWVSQASVICGLREITVELRVRNQAAKGLYHSLGFTLLEEVADYYAAGENAYRMTLRLTAEDERVNAIQAHVDAGLRRIADGLNKKLSASAED